MFADKDSIQISLDGQNFLSVGEYITAARTGWHKVWSGDSGRNLAFEMIGSLGGIFPKITLFFGRLTPEQEQILAPYFDAPIQYVKYKNTDGIEKIMETYTGDWETVWKKMGRCESFEVSFIARSKRR